MKASLGGLLLLGTVLAYKECREKLKIPENKNERIPELRLKLNKLAGSSIGLCHYFIDTGKTYILFLQFILFSDEHHRRSLTRRRRLDRWLLLVPRLFFYDQLHCPPVQLSKVPLRVPPRMFQNTTIPQKRREKAEIRL